MDPATQEALTLLTQRLSDLEDKIDTIIRLVERANGAWTFAKYVGGFVIGCSALWQFLSDHIKYK